MIVTSAPTPAATRHAFSPEIPPPSTTTLPGRTPDAPLSSTPRPPLRACRHHAPAWIARRPATSLIGASSGRLASSSWMVS